MPRHVYRESDRIGGFVTLLGKRVTDYNPDIIVPGEWVAECAGPSHPDEVRGVLPEHPRHLLQPPSGFWLPFLPASRP